MKEVSKLTSTTTPRKVKASSTAEINGKMNRNKSKTTVTDLKVLVSPLPLYSPSAVSSASTTSPFSGGGCGAGALNVIGGNQGLNFGLGGLGGLATTFSFGRIGGGKVLKPQPIMVTLETEVEVDVDGEEEEEEEEEKETFCTRTQSSASTLEIRSPPGCVCDTSEQSINVQDENGMVRQREPPPPPPLQLPQLVDVSSLLSPPPNTWRARPRGGHVRTRSRSAPPQPMITTVIKEPDLKLETKSISDGDRGPKSAPLAGTVIEFEELSAPRKRTNSQREIVAFPSGPRTKGGELIRPPPPLLRPTTFWRKIRKSGVTSTTFSPSSHLVRRSTFIAAGLSLDAPVYDLSACCVESRIGFVVIPPAEENF